MNISRGEVDMRSFFCPELKVGHLNLDPIEELIVCKWYVLSTQKSKLSYDSYLF